jgi:hypothetical protein
MCRGRGVASDRVWRPVQLPRRMPEKSMVDLTEKPTSLFSHHIINFRAGHCMIASSMAQASRQFERPLMVKNKF